MISERLVSLVRCPACRAKLVRGDNATLTCMECGVAYPQQTDTFLDLRPRIQFPEQTKYLDESLHIDARHERVSPPLLGSKIRNDMLRRFLQPSPNDRVADLGCGSGRTLLWNRDWRAALVGIDIAPFFSEEAGREVDLLLGDLRRLPFANGTFTRAYSLDVLEHLSPDALREMLAEANRVLAPGGRLFIYTHVRKNARIASGLRWINAAARALERVGWVDMRQDRLRKSDHLNPLQDIPELERVVAAAGFRISRITYYTPIVGGLVENILIRIVERSMTRRAARRLAATGGAGASDGERSRKPLRTTGSSEDEGSESAPSVEEAAAIRAARKAAKQRIASKGPTYAGLRALSAVMKLDLLFFGRLRSGPFFALLEKRGDDRGLTNPS